MTNEQLFVHIVEAGSLSAAAQRARTSVSTVSRGLKALEERLGVTLMTRSSRRLVLTEAGTTYVEGLRRLHAQTRALEAEVTGQAETPTGLLRIAAPRSMGARFVVPVVAAMRRDFPGLSIDVVFGSTLVDLAAQDIDVAVRVGSLPDSALRARRICEEPRGLFAAPAYLAARGMPQVPADLAQHAFLSYRDSTRPKHIQVGLPDASTHRVRVHSTFAINDVPALVALVAAGHGMHVGPRWAFEQAETRGEVVRVRPSWTFDGSIVHCVWRPSAFVPAKMRHFVDRFATHMQERTTARASISPPAG